MACLLVSFALQLAAGSNRLVCLIHTLCLFFFFFCFDYWYVPFRLWITQCVQTSYVRSYRAYFGRQEGEEGEEEEEGKG